MNVEKMSTGEIAARLTYPSEIAEALTAFRSNAGDLFPDHLARWIKAIEPERRRNAMQTLMDLADETGRSLDRAELAGQLLVLDEATIKSLGGGVVIAGILRQLAMLPRSQRNFLMENQFPVRAVDETRARLWSIINAAGFSAADLVETLPAISRTHPDRLAAIRAFALKGTPLPTCKPGPCKSSRTDLSCPTGSFLAEELTCAPYAR